MNKWGKKAIWGWKDRCNKSFKSALKRTEKLKLLERGIYDEVTKTDRTVPPSDEIRNAVPGIHNVMWLSSAFHDSTFSKEFFSAVFLLRIQSRLMLKLWVGGQKWISLKSKFISADSFQVIIELLLKLLYRTFRAKYRCPKCKIESHFALWTSEDSVDTDSDVVGPSWWYSVGSGWIGNDIHQNISSTNHSSSISTPIKKSMRSIGS